MSHSLYFVTFMRSVPSGDRETDGLERNNSVPVFKVDLKQPYLPPIEEFLPFRLTQLADLLVTRCIITARLVTCSSGSQKMKFGLHT